MITDLSINKSYNIGRYAIIPDIYLKIVSNNINYSDFRFNVYFKIGNTVVYRMSVVPNVSGTAITNISNVLKQYRRVFPKLGRNDIIESLLNTTITIIAYEYFNGAEQGSRTISLSFLNQHYATYDDELAVNGIQGNSVIITKYDNCQISLLKPLIVAFANDAREILIGVVNKAGVVISLTQIYNEIICSLNITRYVQQLGITQPIGKIVIQGYSNAITLYVKDRDCYNIRTICYLSDAGVWEAFQFVDYVEKESFEATKYKQYQYLYDGTENKTGINKVVATAQTRIITVWTDWVSEDVAQYLYRQIFRSTEVYELIDTGLEYKYIPITPVHAEVEYKRNRYEDLINASFTFETLNSLAW